MTDYNIRIVGAGGIGSYFCRSLHTAIQQKQLDKKITIHVYDSDEVESKNIRYQCFDDIDIASYKSDIMNEKYGFLSHTVLVTKKELQLWNKSDIVVSCVDNKEFREQLFKRCSEENSPHFIDLRSEGRFICYFTKSKSNTLDKLLKSVSSERQGSGSCQIPYRFANSIIDWGNKIIAEIGVQLLLNYLRNETYNSHLVLQI